MISWNDSVTALKRIGEKKGERLGRLGISTIGDLLFYAPFRYDDWSQRLPVTDFREEGMEVVFYGRVVDWEQMQWRPGRTLIKALLRGEQGDIVAVWFNRPHLHKLMKKDSAFLIVGKLRLSYGRQIVVERHILIRKEEELKKWARLRPVYRATENLKSTEIEQAVSQGIKDLVPRLEEPFPERVYQKIGSLSLQVALRQMHYPDSLECARLARGTLATFELFAMMLWVRETDPFHEIGIAQEAKGDLRADFEARLPYELTPAQRRVTEEIIQDMKRPVQMHRLLQGDVGSGKTTVAALAILQGVESGSQAALMAPTEVLARQHYVKLSKILESVGVQVSLLTGQLKEPEKQRILKDIASGETQVVIGTHALLEEKAVFQQLGLVIIDEQHRFGVRQRQELETKGQHPDVLVMTATPIPRSLALTVYGNLDISVIDELPKGRGAIQTIWMREGKRQDMYGFVAKELEKGRQVYVVCPTIEPSENLELQDVETLSEVLANTVFPDWQVGVLHGRLSGLEKENLMASFRQGEVQILVATTVIEVGIDVPNATIMIIENAERFGLAQLHQLRGRIGRGPEKSYCILISEAKSAESEERLRTLVQTTDGFLIAEADLRLRGAGELLGLRQHGADMFRIADLLTDTQSVVAAQKLLDYKDVLNEAWRHRFLADIHRMTTP